MANPRANGISFEMLDQTQEVASYEETDPLHLPTYHDLLYEHVVYSVHVHNVCYTVYASIKRSERGALVDRGANGGIAGGDLLIIHEYLRKVDVTGIDNHELNSLKLVDGIAYAESHVGPVILLFRQYAYYGRGRSIHSAGQLEHFKNKIDDRSQRVGGSQCIRTVEGHILPLDIISGLPYLKMRAPTQQERDTLPMLTMTGGNEWDPSVLDYVQSDKDDWYANLKGAVDGISDDGPFDQLGNFKDTTPRAPAETQLPDPSKPEVNVLQAEDADDDDESVPPLALVPDRDYDSDDDSDSDPDQEDDMTIYEAFHVCSDLNRQYFYEHDVSYDDSDPDEATTSDEPPKVKSEDEPADSVPSKSTPVSGPVEVKKKKPDYEKLRHYFLFVPREVVQKTFEATTQYATNIMSGAKIQQTNQSPCPANNVWRRNEDVASDTIKGACPAVDDGSELAQLYIGRRSFVSDVFGMTNEAEFINTLQDVARKRGAMDKLITDSAKVETSKRVTDFLRNLCIDDWQSEPHYQHQDHAERVWRYLKKNVEWIMNWRDVDPAAWLLCLQWVSDVMNHTA